MYTFKRVTSSIANGLHPKPDSERLGSHFLFVCRDWHFKEQSQGQMRMGSITQNGAWHGVVRAQQGPTRLGAKTIKCWVSQHLAE